MKSVRWFFGGLLLGLGPPAQATVPCGTEDGTVLELVSVTRITEAQPLPADTTAYLSSYWDRARASGLLYDPEAGRLREVSLIREKP